jgi:branched-chain amino acid aminotransferase
MYAFLQRGDAEVVDEPLYACYLTNTGHDRPYKQQVQFAKSSLYEVLINRHQICLSFQKVVHAERLSSSLF